MMVLFFFLPYFLMYFRKIIGPRPLCLSIFRVPRASIVRIFQYWLEALRAGASPHIYSYSCDCIRSYVRTSCPKSSTCFFFSDISIFLRRKCYTRFFFSDISIFPKLYAMRYMDHGFVSLRRPWIRPPWNRPAWIRPPWNRPSAREATLRKRRERDRDRRARESSEQREARLSRRRLADRDRARARRGSETATQREVRLARRRIADRSRRVSQSQLTEEREARLHQLRVTQQQRIATESTEEREARLQQVRVTQQQRCY